VWLSGATTLVCLVLALPMAFQMARVGPRMRQWLLLLVSFPFLSNFLIRIFAWKSLLHPEGPLTRLLVWLHVVPEDALLLNNVGAVLLVLIYTQLPFAILPLYAAAEKFDFGLLDAARDLGAGPWRSFSKVFRSRRAARSRLGGGDGVCLLARPVRHPADGGRRLG
jgi:ABC-type spermidine/putrescine transport system permease subunit I